MPTAAVGGALAGELSGELICIQFTPQFFSIAHSVRRRDGPHNPAALKCTGR